MVNITPPSRYRHFEQFFIFIGFITLVSILGDWWNVYEFDSDEGLNLEKGALAANGYKLYSEIWSDQPPILTHILAFVHQIFPFSIIAARATILLFSALMAVSLFRIVLRFEGRAAAWASVLILISGALFLRLSVSVMIGLPSIALMILSLDVMTSGSGYRNGLRAIAGGVFFALALCTKFSVVVALPALLVAAWISFDKPGSSRMKGPLDAQVEGCNRGLKAMALMMSSLVLSLISIIYLTEMLYPEQLLAPHIIARDVSDFSQWGGLRSILRQLRNQSSAAFYLGMAGLVLGFLKPALSRLIPVLWLAVAAITLSVHRPLWYHHILLLVIPLSWLGGIAISELLRTDGFFRKHILAGNRLTPLYRIMTAGLVLACLVFSGWRAGKNLVAARALFNQPPGMSQLHAQFLLQRFHEDAAPIITDNPIDAYRLGALVPPELAVWSSKRMRTGNLDFDIIIKNIIATPEAQVSLRRFSYDPGALTKIGRYRIRTYSVSQQPPGESLHHFAPDTGLMKLRLEKEGAGTRGKKKQVADPFKVRALELLRRLSSLGLHGIGGVWDSEKGLRFDRIQSVTPLPHGAIVTRPPGSAQELGACMLAMWRKSGEMNFAVEALRIGQALVSVQTPDGGWGKVAPFGLLGNYSSNQIATFDDGIHAAVLYFAFDLQDALDGLDAQTPAWLEGMIHRGLGFVLKSQYPAGGWPQSLAPGSYHGLVTINDDAMTGLIRLLTHTYQRNGERKYLDAAVKAGGYLLRVQGRGDQPAFAQQYAKDDKPAAARAFEPVAYSSLETAYAVNALIDLYIATHDARFRAGAEKAVNWLKRSQIAPGQWARFYKIGTNQLLFADRKGNIHRNIKDLPAGEQTHYRWVGDRKAFPEIGMALDRVALLNKGGNALARYDARLARAALLPLVPTARVKLGEPVAEPSSGRLVSTRMFVKECAALLAGNDNGAFPE